jgi:site-specific recombinase XerD
MLQEVVDEYIASLSLRRQEPGGINSHTIMAYRKDLSQVSRYLKRRNRENWQH